MKLTALITTWLGLAGIALLFIALMQGFARWRLGDAEANLRRRAQRGCQCFGQHPHHQRRLQVLVGGGQFQLQHAIGKPHETGVECQLARRAADAAAGHQLGPIRRIDVPRCRCPGCRRSRIHS